MEFRAFGFGAFSFGYFLIFFTWIASDAQINNCTKGTAEWIANGRCDLLNNNDLCNYDGGDCCQCDCVDGADFSCGDNGFSCVDPASGCINPSATYPNCSQYWTVDDGICDFDNNNKECEYDGGDCCECDCTTSSEYTCGSDNVYSCLDPTSDCVHPFASEFPSCSGYLDYISDGYCDPDNNNKNCGYDGGDCCECDCVDSTGYSSCGENGFFCVDPMSDCADAIVAEYPNCSGYLQNIEDGYCNDYNNNEECGYDGGDCCECDCTATSDDACDDYYSFNCVDPTSDCFDPVASTYPYCSGYLDYISDGECDNDNNNEDCGYDGGDCCECDCASSSEYSCGIYNFFNCLDPASDCQHPLATEFPSCSGYLDYVGDQLCDPENNNEACGYDGGDCCKCDCVDSTGYYSCGGNDFFCVDPTSECVDQSEFSGCRGILENMGEGICDDENNNEDCGYDGGDCCLCTCVGNDCPTSDADCLDPNGSGSEIYECGEAQSTAPPCSTELQRKWFVQTTVHAHDLAEATYCANGTFEVEWRGEVIVNRTIFVVDGTVMQITGVGMNATIDGGNTVRPFTVISADLHVSGVTFRNGHATSGGSVAAADAKLNFYGTTFISNSVSRRGGAIFVSNASAVFFGGNTTLANNTAGDDGGALCVSDRSTVSFGGSTTLTSNTADDDGGALYVSDGSSAFFEGTTVVVSNIAQYDGGALFVSTGSCSSWTDSTTFFANTADFGSGGALYLSDGSNSSWTGETTFSDNTGEEGGGALAMWEGSNAIWSGRTIFSGNDATYGVGGAVHLDNGSMSWTGETSFHGNHAESGGALSIEESSIVSWKAETRFSSNSAQFGGGALYVGYVCNVSWEVSTVFTENSANTGGAIYISSGSTVEWSEDTTFTSNRVSLHGGAVSFSDDSFYGESRIVINGTSNFLNNTSGTNGGGVALMGDSSWSGTTNVTFARNTASLGGGAVYVSSFEKTSVFSRTTFAFNSAPVGGAVYSPGSSTLTDQFGDAMVIPTNFSGCTFTGNVAETTGGAVDSASGEVNFISTSFRSNIAGVGGALRLAGTASIEDCEFIENSSGVGGGPAVSKIGDQMNITSSSFLNNIYTCGNGMILDVSEEGNLYDTVCVGCGPCHNCVVEDQRAVPRGCISLLDAGIEHATSDGGIVEKLNISKGYWRATSTSRDILECFNRNACLGGVALRISDYCKKGFKGPYCSLCEDGYTSGVGFSCIKCTPNNKTLSIAFVTTVAVVGVVVCVAIVLHLLSGEMTGTGRGCIDRIARRIPLQCVKIIIVAWQILTQVESVTKATYPGIYKPFLDLVNIVTFNFTRPLMTGCLMKTNFHDQLLVATIAPIIVMCLLALTYVIALRKHRGSDEAVQVVQQKHMSMALLIAFLVYSTVSSTIFQTFASEALDTDDPLQDKQDYLIADYSITCDGAHKKYQIYAGFMVMLYPVGIPAVYVVLLFRNRRVLEDKSRRESDPSVRAMTSLWEPYKPWRFYYEIIECGRRVMLTSVLLLIKGGTAAQIAVTIVLAFFFAVTFEILSPYESSLDTWVSRLGHAVIFSSMYLALLIKVNVSDEAEDSQKAFGAVLVAVHVCMMLVVVTESIFVSFALKTNKNCEDPTPRQRSSNIIANASNVLTEDDEASGKNNDP